MKEGGSEAERDADREGDGSHDETAFARTVGQAFVNPVYCENRLIFGFICMGFGNTGGHVHLVKIRLW